MFNLFKRKPDDSCPIDRKTRLWMENSFLWLLQEFGEDNVRTKQMLLPKPKDFPVKYDGSFKSLESTAAIVATQMEIEFAEIKLEIYKQNIQSFDSGFGPLLFTQADDTEGETLSAGLYFDRDENGKYHIFIEEANLLKPESMVAVLAHEFAHIKLLGEHRLNFNDELLTDLTTVAFGLGVFNANACFREVKTFNVSGHSKMGYLTQQEWGYALALYAYFREERDPEWSKMLTPNIRFDFKQGQAFILANAERIFIEQDIEGNEN